MPMESYRIISKIRLAVVNQALCHLRGGRVLEDCLVRVSYDNDGRQRISFLPEDVQFDGDLPYPAYTGRVICQDPENNDLHSATTRILLLSCINESNSDVLVFPGCHRYTVVRDTFLQGSLDMRVMGRAAGGVAIRTQEGEELTFDVKGAPHFSGIATVYRGEVYGRSAGLTIAPNKVIVLEIDDN